jgi:hypothetical protein
MPQVAGSPQLPRLLQSVEFRLPIIATPELAFVEAMANPNVCPRETVPSTTAVAVNGGVKDSMLWIVPTVKLVFT